MRWEEKALSMFVERKTWNEIFDELICQFPDLTPEQARNKIRDYIRSTPEYAQRKNEEVEKSSVSYSGDGTVVSTKFLKLRDGTALTHKDLLELHGLDPTQWEVVNCINNYWNSQRSGGGLQISYQSKLTAKPIKRAINLEEIGKHFAQLDREYRQPRPVIYAGGNQMAEVNIADLHLGKLCWHGDTGNDYDYRIAREMFYKIIGEIKEELRHKKLEYILFVVFNDFFNSDNLEQTTTAGTPQDTDTRWPKMFNVGCEMIVTGADMLAEIAPVKILYIKSNHDEMTGYAAVQYASAWFRNDDNITVDTDARGRKFILYGNTLLGFTHGDKDGKEGTKEKASRLASSMPIEAKELWGKAKYHEIHAAHLHSEQMIQEINGVIVRRISSPTATDAYHYDAAYIGSVRKAQTFIYDKERGLMQIINTPVESL